MKRSLLMVSLMSLVVACRSDDVDCSGIGAVETDSGVCDCPAGTTWIPIKAICEATSSSIATDAGARDAGVQLADSGIDAGGSAPDAARLDATQAATGDAAPPAVDAADAVQVDAAAVIGAAADAATVDTGVSSTPPVAMPPACVPTSPKTEVCDGKDNDCDGVVDNGPTEVCDTKDNDCDGTIDEGFVTGGPCTAGNGECLATGTLQCDPSGAVACTAVAKAAAAAAEVCGDGKDNDCNGVVDDGKKAWYSDCDADGYFAAVPFDCGVVPPAVPACSWRETAAAPFDCQDQDPLYKPGADFAYAGAHGGDRNCDGATEKPMAGAWQIVFSSLEQGVKWNWQVLARQSDCPGLAVIQGGQPVFQPSWSCSQTPLLLQEVDAACTIVLNGKTVMGGQWCR
jgi:Putative metal-binding motif